MSNQTYPKQQDRKRNLQVLIEFSITEPGYSKDIKDRYTEELELPIPLDTPKSGEVLAITRHVRGSLFDLIEQFSWGRDLIDEGVAFRILEFKPKLAEVLELPSKA